MKNLKFNLLMAFVLLSFSMQAQELSRYVFASGGETAISNNLIMSWTIGQSGLVGSFTEPSLLSLNVGFQQKDTIINPNFISEPKNQYSFRAYPNPFQRDFYFSLQSEYIGNISYSLYDNNGKMVLQKHNTPNAGKLCEEKIELNNNPPGMYNLTIFVFPDNHSPIQFSIKLIKL